MLIFVKTFRLIRTFIVLCLLSTAFIRPADARVLDQNGYPPTGTIVHGASLDTTVTTHPTSRTSPDLIRAAAFGTTSAPNLPAPIRAIKAYVLEFNPLINGQPLTQKQSYFDPLQLEADYGASVNKASGGRYGYQVAKHVVIRDYPYKANNYKFDQATYLACLANSASSTHCTDGIDYPRALQTAYDPTQPGVTACQMLASGAADEIWLWGGPWMGYYEFVNLGSQSSYCPSVGRPVSVMGFSYERSVALMVHDLGHRAEQSLGLALGSPWSSFAFDLGRYNQTYSTCPATPDAGHPEVDANNAHVGNVHFPPNAYCHYQYNRNKPVQSDAEDWKLRYPNLNGQKTTINRDSWNCTAVSPYDDACQLNYLIWWFDHMPRVTGGNGQSNWWRYLFFDAGPCTFAPASTQCKFDTRSVYSSPYDNNQVVEFVTAYGRYFKFDSTGNMIGSNDLTAVSRFVIPGGPCVGRAIGTCTFDTRTVYVSPFDNNQQIEFITAYGRYWKYDMAGNFLSSNDLTTVARYVAPGGPCVGRAAGTCLFDTRSVYASPSDGNQQVEFITAYGRLWKYDLSGNLLAAFDLSANPPGRFITANGPCVGRPAGTCRFDSRTVYVSQFDNNQQIEFITAYGRYWKYDMNGNLLLTQDMTTASRWN